VSGFDIFVVPPVVPLASYRMFVVGKMSSLVFGNGGCACRVSSCFCPRSPCVWDRALVFARNRTSPVCWGCKACEACVLSPASVRFISMSPAFAPSPGLPAVFCGPSRAVFSIFRFFFQWLPFGGFWSISLPKVHLVQGHVFGGLFTATVSFDELDDLLRS
jgi:hypothetical protein